MGDAFGSTTFRPASSRGWLWMVALILMLGVSLLPLLDPAIAAEEGVVVLWITAGFMVPLITFFLATLASLPAMRYELTTDSLLISCGPLLRYRVSYADIVDVRCLDLTPSLWSSMRFPGLALWSVHYADVGAVRMCATRMANGIIVISTASRRYGITPAEEDRFIGMLLAMLPPEAA